MPAGELKKLPTITYDVNLKIMSIDQNISILAKYQMMNQKVSVPIDAHSLLILSKVKFMVSSAPCTGHFCEPKVVWFEGPCCISPNRAYVLLQVQLASMTPS